MKMKKIRDGITKCTTLIGKTRFDHENIAVVEVYKRGLLADLEWTSKKFIDILEHDCIAVAGRCTPIVMFVKLQGDISRYVAEEISGNKLRECKENTLAYYRFADALQGRLLDLQINANVAPALTTLRLSLA